MSRDGSQGKVTPQFWGKRFRLTRAAFIPFRKEDTHGFLMLERTLRAQPFLFQMGAVFFA